MQSKRAEWLGLRGTPTHVDWEDTHTQGTCHSQQPIRTCQHHFLNLNNGNTRKATSLCHIQPWNLTSITRVFWRNQTWILLPLMSLLPSPYSWVIDWVWVWVISQELRWKHKPKNKINWWMLSNRSSNHGAWQ